MNRSPVGNRVLVYLHGGGYAALAAQNYLYLIGLFLAEQTGQAHPSSSPHGTRTHPPLPHST